MSRFGSGGGPTSPHRTWETPGGGVRPWGPGRPTDSSSTPTSLQDTASGFASLCDPILGERGTESRGGVPVGHGPEVPPLSPTLPPGRIRGRTPVSGRRYEGWPCGPRLSRPHHSPDGTPDLTPQIRSVPGPHPVPFLSLQASDLGGTRRTCVPGHSGPGPVRGSRHRTCATGV